MDTENQEVSTDRGRNTELVIVTYVFGFLFLLLAGYLIYLNVAKRDEINSNVYNTKQDTRTDAVIRGSIVTEEGAVLAVTNVDENGSESRYYPYANVFAHVIGYANNGKAGLEAAANKDLLGSHSSFVSQLSGEYSNEKSQGDTVVVTLDPTLQQAAYNALGTYKGAVVVL